MDKIANIIPVQFMRLNLSLNKTNAATALKSTIPILFTGITIELAPGYSFSTLMRHHIEK